MIICPLCKQECVEQRVCVRRGEAICDACDDRMSEYALESKREKWEAEADTQAEFEQEQEWYAEVETEREDGKKYDE